MTEQQIVRAFERGSLWQKVQAVTQSALRNEAIRPITTKCCWIEQQEIRFLVRVATQLMAKDRQRSVDQVNPFLPYDESLFVADVDDAHLCLLNKFNVVPHHILIVTRQFEEQRQPLTLQNFRALALCLSEYESMGFYNSGPQAGASQSHKHLQLVPLPLTKDRPFIPLGSLIERDARSSDKSHAAPGRCDRLPFAHRVLAVDAPRYDPAGWAALLDAGYRRMMSDLKLDIRAGAGDYNLLVCRRWMMLIPRQHECFGSVSINALGFAGAFFVRGEGEFAELERAGPLEVLERVAAG